MEEGGVKCWLSTSILLSGALSGAFFFSLILTSDSRTLWVQTSAVNTRTASSFSPHTFTKRHFLRPFNERRLNML